MTRLLVSVRSAEEALSALDGGADLIDVKEPDRGPLGAAPARVVAEIVDAVGARVPLSVALGELEEMSTPFAEHPVESGRQQGMELKRQDWGEAWWDRVSYAKLGMAGMAGRADWPVLWRKALCRIGPGVGRVAVVYADWEVACAPRPEEVLREGLAAGCVALLVDTYSKSGPGLTGLWNEERLHRFVTEVQEAGMLAVVGGGLTEGSLGDVLACGPDYVAVRGAACRGGRQGRLDRDLVSRLRARLSAGTGFT